MDENSNKLVMAVQQYVTCEWFTVGCQVIKVFNDILIQPLQELLGIDKYYKIKREDRSWTGIKDFFSSKMDELKCIESKEANSNKDNLIKSCATKVRETIERQLSKIVFFKPTEDHLGPTFEEMKYTPLTNSGSESRMAELDVKVKFSGGAAPVKTLSNKQVISVNKYLCTKDFSTDEKILEHFTWERTSKEATEATKMLEVFCKL